MERLSSIDIRNEGSEFQWILNEMVKCWEAKFESEYVVPSQPSMPEEYVISDGGAYLVLSGIGTLLAEITYWILFFVGKLIIFYPSWDWLVGLPAGLIIGGILWCMELDDILIEKPINRYRNNRYRKVTQSPTITKDDWIRERVAEITKRFIEDEQFRIQETRRVLSEYTLPAYRGQIEHIKAEISTEAHNKRTELEGDEKILLGIIELNDFLNEEHKIVTKLALEENRRQQEELAPSQDLQSTLVETERAMGSISGLVEGLGEISTKLSNYEADLLVIEKYADSGYQSVNRLARELFTEQIEKLQEITIDLERVNQSGQVIISQAKQLGNGDSPVTKLLQADSNAIN